MARADLAVVALPDPEGEDLVVVAADGIGEQRIRGVALEIDASLLGSVFKSGQMEHIADAAADARTRIDISPDTPLGPAILVPLGGAGEVRGVLAVARAVGGAVFDDTDVQLVSDLAFQAAVVLELADRRRDSELLSLYADRDRIGRDLHDLAIQRLFATSMSLQGAFKITQKPAVAKRIAQAISDLDDTVKVIRSTIFALHSHERGEDDAPSVRAEVIESCERVAEQLGFSPSVRFSGPVDTLVPEEAAEHLAAVLREALSNAARHARASKVEVEVGVDGTHVTLTVIDDGVGIRAGGHRSGLANLAERAQQLGGRFSADPGASGGTVLVWSVPLEAVDED
jgi:signal transduction histidine kinase